MAPSASNWDVQSSNLHRTVGRDDADASGERFLGELLGILDQHGGKGGVHLQEVAGSALQQLSQDSRQQHGQLKRLACRTL